MTMFDYVAWMYIIAVLIVAILARLFPIALQIYNTLICILVVKMLIGRIDLWSKPLNCFYDSVSRMITITVIMIISFIHIWLLYVLYNMAMAFLEQLNAFSKFILAGLMILFLGTDCFCFVLFTIFITIHCIKEIYYLVNTYIYTPLKKWLLCGDRWYIECLSENYYDANRGLITHDLNGNKIWEHDDYFQILLKAKYWDIKQERYVDGFDPYVMTYNGVSVYKIHRHPQRQKPHIFMRKRVFEEQAAALIQRKKDLIVIQEEQQRYDAEFEINQVILIQKEELQMLQQELYKSRKLRQKMRKDLGWHKTYWEFTDSDTEEEDND